MEHLRRFSEVSRTAERGVAQLQCVPLNFCVALLLSTAVRGVTQFAVLPFSGTYRCTGEIDLLISFLGGLHSSQKGY